MPMMRYNDRWHWWATEWPLEIYTKQLLAREIKSSIEKKRRNQINGRVDNTCILGVSFAALDLIVNKVIAIQISALVFHQVKERVNWSLIPSNGLQWPIKLQFEEESNKSKQTGKPSRYYEFDSSRMSIRLFTRVHANDTAVYIRYTVNFFFKELA